MSRLAERAPEIDGNRYLLVPDFTNVIKGQHGMKVRTGAVQGIRASVPHPVPMLHEIAMVAVLAGRVLCPAAIMVRCR